LRNLDEADRCQVLSSREDENKDKVKQNGAQNENLTLLHCSSQASELLLVGFGWMEESDSHLSAIYSLHTVTFIAVQCNDECVHSKMHASFEGNYSSFCTDPACQITTTTNTTTTTTNNSNNSNNNNNNNYYYCNGPCLYF